MSCVELLAADPWMAIDAHRPVSFEKASRWRPKLSGAAANKTSSPEAASRKAASKWRSKKVPVSIGFAETPAVADLEGRIDQRRAAASSRTATWYFAARSRARPERSAVKSQRGPRLPPEDVGVQTSASSSLGTNQVARRQMEIDEGEVEIWIGMQRRRCEANLDLVFQIEARRAFDLIQPVVIGAERRPGAIVAAGVMERYIGLELARPGEDVGFIDPVFDDTSELGVARAPAAALSHMGKSKSGGQPCAAGG